jgi:hypothetical protein
MKKSKLAFGLFSVCMLLVVQSVFAQSVMLDASEPSVDWDRLEKAEQANNHSTWFDGRDSFKITLNKNYSYYMTSTTKLVGVKAVGPGYPKGRGYCEFNFYNERYDYVSGIRVHIRDATDTNVCNRIEGVSAVTYKNQPALLATVQYHRGIDPAKTVNELGNNYHRFTALLVLDPHSDNSLSIHQDDSCLGPMNQIGELAVARKRLAECSQ